MSIVVAVAAARLESNRSFWES